MNRDAGRDAHLMSGAYALDAVTADEAALVEAEMRESEDLRGEIAELTDTAVLLGLALPAVTPPSIMRSRLLDAIETVPQLSAEEPVVESPEIAVPPVHDAERLRSAAHVARRRRGRRIGRPSVLLAMAAVAVLLFGGGVLVQRAVLGPQSDYARITAAADAESQSARVTGGGTALVTWSEEEGGTAVVLNGVAAPKDKVLQIWTLRGDEATSEGLYQPSDDARYAVFDGAPDEGERIAVSVEPTGGSSRPTTTPIVAVSIPA